MKYIAKDGKCELILDEEYIPPQDKYEWERLPEKFDFGRLLAELNAEMQRQIEITLSMTPEQRLELEELSGFSPEAISAIKERFSGDFDPVLEARRLISGE